MGITSNVYESYLRSMIKLFMILLFVISWLSKDAKGFETTISIDIDQEKLE